MQTRPLTVDVYVAPMRPFKGAPAQAPGDEPMWSPMSSTLIAGTEEGILVDTLVTNDQVDELAEWVRGFGKRITGVYITHGHSDHWIGLARVRQHLPEALSGDEFELEGQVLRAVSVGQGDTAHSTVLHVPSVDLVVGGDVVYN